MGFKSLAIYIAVASPSTFELVASITSLTSGVILETSDFILIESGPMPSRGDIEPWRTWYKPWYSLVFSIGRISFAS